MRIFLPFAGTRSGPADLFRGIATVVALLASNIASAQGPRPGDLGASNLDIGTPGIAWYTTWDSGLKEAKRSGRPIMFVMAATQCHGISGVF